MFGRSRLAAATVLHGQHHLSRQEHQVRKEIFMLLQLLFEQYPMAPSACPFQTVFNIIVKPSSLLPHNQNILCATNTESVFIAGISPADIGMKQALSAPPKKEYIILMQAKIYNFSSN